LTLFSRAWDTRAVPFAALLLGLALAAGLSGDAALPRRAAADEGRAPVRLVRLLSEVPDSERTGPEPLHDLRLRLKAGNIVLLSRGGERAAVLPIERTGGRPDSLRYFYYIEQPRLFWILPGARAKGVATVPDGGRLEFDSFRLYWRGAGDLGWIYFPASAETQSLRFSVVGGRTVDQANPMDTRYWIELGAPEGAGF
jgi:hypothetical protein